VSLKKYDQCCTKCDWNAEILVEPGTHPRCPKCKARTERFYIAGYGVIGDDIPGGLVLENLGDKPVTVYSKSEAKHEAAKRGLETFVRHVGTPGSDKNPHTTRWT
jgi:hypothetical protein